MRNERNDSGWNIGDPLEGGFTEKFRAASDECLRTLNEARGKAIDMAIELLGIKSPKDATGRLSLHEYTKHSPPFFVVWDSLTDAEVSPRFYWYVEENVFKVTTEPPKDLR